MNENLGGIIFILLFIILIGGLSYREKRKAKKLNIYNKNNPQTRPIRIYKGNRPEANEQFEIDKQKASKDNYYPISERYEKVGYSSSDFITAAILCIFIVGLFIFIYMLIVKPKGQLVVVYEKGKKTKICPLCAEEVKIQAKVCKHCGNNLETP
jgi:hypothetical protein